MKKVLYSFLWLATVGGFLFLTSCGEDSEDPAPGGSITLSTADGAISGDTLLAAPGAEVKIAASLGATSTETISVVTNNSSVVSVPSTNTITSGDTITVTIGASASLGDEATLTFSADGINEQLIIEVGFNTVVDAALATPNLSILVAALQEAELVTTLQGGGPFTVFAPTDAAFTALLTQLGVTAEELLARDDLEDILLYHVVAAEAGAVLSGDLTDNQIIATRNGDFDLLASVDGSTVMINGATVVTPDITTGNGVVHIIDEVLLPQTVAEYEAVLLEAPLGDRTSKTFFNSKNGMTYTVQEVIDGNDISSADIDFGYYYGQTNEASIASPNDYPTNIQDLTSSGANWSALNATTFRTTNLTLDDFNAIGAADAARLVQEYEVVTEDPTGEINNLAAGELYSFRTVDNRYGIIRILEITPGDGANGEIEIEVKVTN